MKNGALADVQMLSPDVGMSIDRVGVRGLRYPVTLRDKANGTQKCMAIVDLGVDLPPYLKGTHMSRLVEALESWDGIAGCQSMRLLLENMRTRLDARRGWARFKFPYLVRKAAPFGGASANIAYDCAITGELDDNGQSFLLELEVPVMTVCPCSKAISSEGAHSQRAMVRMKIRITNFVWLENFIELAENSASSAVYTLLKREDEKFVTELAFSRPAFVEDVARQAAMGLENCRDVLYYEVEVESMESIHNHNAFAFIAGRRDSTDEPTLQSHRG